METWKPVPGLESVYSISSEGRVMRTGRAPRAQVGHILVPAVDSQGYCRVNLLHKQVQYPRKVHRLVAEAFHGPIPDGYTVNHIDGDKANNRVENLEVITRGANIAHAFRVIKTKSVRGVLNPRATVTEDQVRAIKARLATNESGGKIAADIGVNRSLVYDIKLGRAWTHVE